MNFLRTQTLQRIADYVKLKIEGVPWKTQSNLNISGGRNIVFRQTEAKDETTFVLEAGTKGVLGYWGTLWDTTDQTITSTTTAYVVKLNTADPDNDGVTVTGGDKIVPTTPGNYNVNFSAQLANSDSQAHDAVFWFRKNGVDIPDSGSRVTVPSTHGGVDGHLVFYVDYALHFNAGDYLQIVWFAESTQVRLETLPAGTSPTRPACPSAIVTVVQV